MRTYRKPVRTKGYKNIFCPYYGNCLDHASKRHWEYWTCLHCRYKSLKESIPEEPVSATCTDPYYSISPSMAGKIKNIAL
jgi:hypothetical protein